MGCHILDPVFMALALTSPRSVRSNGGAPNADNWGLDSQVDYTFPATRYTAEGVKSCLAIRDLAHKLGIEMPITEQVELVCHEGASPKHAVMALMSRDMKAE